MSKMISKKLRQICDVCKADKSLTKKRLHAMKSIYPVYTANIGKPFEYADFYNNDEPALIAVNDGAAGKCYVVMDDKFVIGKHASGFKPKPQYKDYLDLYYLKIMLEPKFINKNKAQGLGNLPQSDMLDTEILIPLDDNGNFDLNKQKELSNKYDLIQKEKQLLLLQKEKIKEFELERNDKYKTVNYPLFEIFEPHQGNAIYTKKNINNNKWNGNVPVISSNTDNNGVLDYIDLKYVNKKDYVTIPCLTWSVDGYAGKLFVRNTEENPIGFVANNHCGILFPLIDVKLLYLPYVVIALQSQFFSKVKNSANQKLGNNQMKDILIPFPVDDAGNIDVNAQKEIASNYQLIEKFKKSLISEINCMLNSEIEII